MLSAFVFGKFLPFHKGHEAMINFALSKCDQLTVLVCCSDRENIPGTTRKNWIEKTFEGQQHIEVKVLDYLESELPNTSVSSKAVSKKWATMFKDLFPDHSLVITSEEYGEFVAAYMNIKHIPFDIPRHLFPVSATKVRNDLFANWTFLPDSVKAYYAIKVVILGTESTGKSTLSKKLSSHYNCSLVTEAGRDLIDDSKEFQFEDLHKVAIEHAKRIDEAVVGDSPLIIIDTDIHITKSYSKFIFQKELLVCENIKQSNKADLYLYLNNDVSYIQDGTRLDEKARDLLDQSHRKILNQDAISFVEIRGEWEQRFEQSVAKIDALIMRKNDYKS